MASTLAAQLAAFAAKVGEDLDTVHRKLVVQVAGAIITGSVVDEGRFRNNWVPGIGAPNPNAGNPGGGDGGATLSAISAAIPKPGGKFFITNSLPYAHRLEYEGWSKRMPAGIVRVTAMRFDDYVRKALAA